jgi:hypothetical protein
MKIYLGQIVHYSYKPESAPVPAMVTAIEDAEWVSLYLFSEVPRWLPHVEYAAHCKPVDSSAEPAVNPYGGIFA